MYMDEWIKYGKECELRGKPVLFGPSPTQSGLNMSKKESNPPAISRRPTPPPPPPKRVLREDIQTPRKGDFQFALETEVDPRLFLVILGSIILAVIIGSIFIN